MYEYMVESTKNKDNKFCFNYFGKRITYSELYAQIDKAAAALTKMGLKQGDVVVYVFLLCQRTIILCMQLTCLGEYATILL